MICVNDSYDLVPELFTAYPEFINTKDAEVDVLPAYGDESVQHSNRPTIFIQPEPDIHRADTAYHQQIAAKSNAAWAVSGHAISSNNNWKLEKWFSYYASLTMTVRVNPPMPDLESGHKSWLATALLGGWTANRGQLLHRLRRLGILDQCLINYHERTPVPIQQRHIQRQQEPNLYFNIRTPELDLLDNPVFLGTAFQTELDTVSINTCRGIPSMPPFLHAYVSQFVPWKIYNSAYISIVAETECQCCPDLFFISEKISRPLLVGHPFVVFGCVGYLAELRKLGFRTFSSWIDESYDLIEDSALRAKAIAHSVKRFSEMSDQHKQQVCKEMKVVTDHNRSLVLDPRWTFASVRNAILDFKKS